MLGMVGALDFSTPAFARLGDVLPSRHAGAGELPGFSLPLSQVAANSLTLKAAHEVLCGRVMWATYEVSVRTSRVRVDLGLLDTEILMAARGFDIADWHDRMIAGVRLDRSFFRGCAGREKQHEAIRKLPRIYHPEGAFVLCNGLFEDGRRFDLVFPEFLRDPTLALSAIPTVEEIRVALGANYQRRSGRRRMSVTAWDLAD
jgi:hypothetical protein